MTGNTLRAYVSRLQNFEAYIQSISRQNPSMSMEACVISYVIACQKNDQAPQSVRGFCVAWKSYCRFANLPYPQVKISAQESPVQALAPAHQRRILQVLNESFTERDRALVSLIMLAGLRTGEIVHANFHDLRFHNDDLSLTVRDEQGTVRRILPISRLARHMILAWILRRREIKAADDALFVSNAGCRLHPNSIRWCVANVGRHVGIELSPQILRNTFIANLAANLSDSETVAALSGLQSTSRLARFMHPSPIGDASVAVQLASNNICGGPSSPL
jgi:site-specific recombinase XerD